MPKLRINATTDISTSKIYDIYSSEGKELDNFIANLEAIRESLIKEGWQDLKISLGIDSGYYDDSPELTASITGTRVETDKEEKERIKQEEREAARAKALAVKKANEKKVQEEQERILYEKLKTKYETINNK